MARTNGTAHMMVSRLVRSLLDILPRRHSRQHQKRCIDSMCTLRACYLQAELNETHDLEGANNTSPSLCTVTARSPYFSVVSPAHLDDLHASTGSPCRVLTKPGREGFDSLCAAPRARRPRETVDQFRPAQTVGDEVESAPSPPRLPQVLRRCSSAGA